MAGCLITKSLNSRRCEYAVSGARFLYLANFYPAAEGDAAQGGVITYKTDASGYISKIYLPTGESFYEIKGEDNTISFQDALVEGGNGCKYRLHTVNAVLNQFDIDALNEGDALSLGRFIAVVIDAAGRVVVLGRTGGLAAPAGGFDYNSGAATTDSTGWTILLQGGSMEIAKLGIDASIIDPLFVAV